MTSTPPLSPDDTEAQRAMTHHEGETRNATRPPQSFRRAATDARPLSRRVTYSRFPDEPDEPAPQSQSFSRSYGSNLPTSLTYINSIDQRLLTLETCCGDGYGHGAKFMPFVFSRCDVLWATPSAPFARAADNAKTSRRARRSSVADFAAPSIPFSHRTVYREREAL